MYICVNIVYDLFYKNIYEKLFRKITKPKKKHIFYFNHLYSAILPLLCYGCDFRKLANAYVYLNIFFNFIFKNINEKVHKKMTKPKNEYIFYGNISYIMMFYMSSTKQNKPFVISLMRNKVYKDVHLLLPQNNLYSEMLPVYAQNVILENGCVIFKLFLYYNFSPDFLPYNQSILSTF